MRRSFEAAFETVSPGGFTGWLGRRRPSPPWDGALGTAGVDHIGLRVPMVKTRQMALARTTDGDFDVDSFLAQPLMAHLASASDDGPRESPVWFLWEEQALWLIGNSRDSFPRRLRADPRCAVGIVDLRLDRGLLRHVGIRGTAEIVSLDPSRLHRLLSRYLGADQEAWNRDFRRLVIDRLDLMVRVEPQSVVARDQSYFSALPTA